MKVFLYKMLPKHLGTHVATVPPVGSQAVLEVDPQDASQAVPEVDSQDNPQAISEKDRCAPHLFNL